MDKPRVDDIRGIPPAIAIEQSNLVKTSRSTVGTITEINDFLKLFWARTALAFCPSCGREIRPESARSIANQVLSVISSAVEGSRGESFTVPSPGSSDFARNDGKAVLVTFWVAIPPKTKPRDLFEFLQQQR